MTAITGIGIAGWRGDGERRVRLERGGDGEYLRGGQLDAAVFPGRWNPRRAIPPDLDPLPAAAALALEDAGWWRPGSGEACEGALVVATDFGPLVPACRLAADLAPAGKPGSGVVSPTDFLFALPSSAMAVLGILFGLREHQATLAGGGAAGFGALCHALDLIRLGRAERVLLAAWSVVEGPVCEPARAGNGSPAEPLRLAVAWCLEGAASQDGRGACRRAVAARPQAVAGTDGSLRLELEPSSSPAPPGPAAPAWVFERLAALPFLAASEWLEYNPDPSKGMNRRP
jgi:hypothetical protein